MSEELTLWVQYSNVALALGGTVACLVALLAGMGLVRLVWTP